MSIFHVITVLTRIKVTTINAAKIKCKYFINHNVIYHIYLFTFFYAYCAVYYTFFFILFIKQH